MFKISATVLVLVFSCTSCSDDPIRINQPGTLSANQNGKTWVGTNSHALIVNENFLISSKSDDGSEISISLNNNVVALYQVDGYDSQYPFNNIVSYISGGSATPVFSSINLTGNEVGRVIIEEINTTDGTISGTFYSKVRRTTPSDSTILFENGIFTKINYVIESSSPPINSASAVINGGEFNPKLVEGTRSLGQLFLRLVQGSNSMIIILPDNSIANTFNLSVFGSTYNASLWDGSTMLFESTSGNLTITEHDFSLRRIKGSFKFIAQSTMGTGNLSVDSGIFDITY